MPPKSTPKAPPNFAALRHYAHISHTAAHTHTHPALPASTLQSQTASHDAALATAIQSLRRLIIDQELSISTLREDTPSTPTLSSSARLRALAAQKRAHDAGFQTIDYIPPADSPLNLLLAYRSVTTVIARTKTSIAAVEAQVAAATAVHTAESAELTEQRQLLSALRSRLAVLQEEERDADLGTDMAAARGVQALVKRRREVGRMTAGVLRELRWFLDEGGLARMLVAEEMGGPVVGDVLDVRVEGGFDKRGKSRKGERRIDEMWGQGEEEPEKRVAREFMEMLEELMNASLETDPYVPLKKETAIVRFLVRAKVAAFHPKDARRLRLIDFGSSVEDG